MCFHWRFLLFLFFFVSCDFSMDTDVRVQRMVHCYALRCHKWKQFYLQNCCCGTLWGLWFGCLYAPCFLQVRSSGWTTARATGGSFICLNSLHVGKSGLLELQVARLSQQGTQHHGEKKKWCFPIGITPGKLQLFSCCYKWAKSKLKPKNGPCVNSAERCY